MGRAARIRLAAAPLALCACGGGGNTGGAGSGCAALVLLSQAEVELVIAQAVTQALALGVDATVAVSDREGNVLGVFRMVGSTADEDDAISGAGTAAYFESDQDAFTTRTAEFIIQPHFPPGLTNTPGGPLFGVQFSNRVASDDSAGNPELPLLTSDGNVIGRDASSAPVGEGITGLTVSGGAGAAPLFKGGCAAGGVGVSASPGANPDDLERIAIAASAGFEAPAPIRATEILLDGIRLPFTAAKPVEDGATILFGLLPGAVEPGFATRPSPGTIAPVTPLTLGGVSGELRLPLVAGVPTIVDSPLPDPVKLTAADVTAILSSAAARSQRIRAAIRRPLGSAMQCFVAVVDRAGNVLGVFRTPDATFFSFDVAIQKARTAAFFSDDLHGYTTRALGFLAQDLYPPGIDNTPPGPLFGLQAELTARGETVGGRLANGITIFPGGAPLYKAGVLVGAIGVSGDGVDQDDLTADGGVSAGFQAQNAVRCDFLTETEAIAGLDDALTRMAGLALDLDVLNQIADCQNRLAAGLQGLRLPWLKFPRNPDR
jgi:uncharacterized protein GlcG (DUF336 family)